MKRFGFCMALVCTGLVIGAPSLAKRVGDHLYDAREAAAADKHREAINHYLVAIKHHSQLRDDIAKELGHQYTWADMPDSAVYWYGIHLERHPADIEARFGMARALSWSNKLDEATTHYRRLLDAQPGEATRARIGIARMTAWKNKLGDAEQQYRDIVAEHPLQFQAKLGLAQVVNWSGRHREAQVLYEELRETHPDNADVEVGTAQSLSWLGRPDEAIRIVENREEKSARDLVSALFAARSPVAQYTYDFSQDTDEIDRRTNTIALTFGPTWLTQLELNFHDGTMQQRGFPDVNRTQWGGRLYQRFGSALAVTVAPGFQSNQFVANTITSETEFNEFIIDTYATLTPRDWLRADIGFFRGTFNNPVPVFTEIVLDETSVGFDWTLAHNIILVTRVAFANFSDDNRRISARQQLVWRPTLWYPTARKFGVTTKTGWGYLDYDKTTANGYYNPNQYVSLFERLEFYLQHRQRWRISLGARLSVDRENRDDWFTVGAVDVNGWVRLFSQLHVRAGYYNSQGRLDTRTGYQADGFYLSTDYRLEKNR